MHILGIRHEDKYAMERRAPLSPNHVEQLVKEKNLKIQVESSARRIFADHDYAYAGADVVNDLTKSKVILGVKEMPSDFFEPEKVYIFFSHVIKGQTYNMPMLKRMMELDCTLVDYEKITDDQNRRIIFFGRYAGLAGMINSLWSMGERLAAKGYTDNPFLTIQQSHHYHSLKEAKEAVSEVGRKIAENGLPDDLLPLTIGFTGNGNVSKGAQEIAALLPGLEITPEELVKLKKRGNIPGNIVYKVIFNENDLSRHKSNPKQFDKRHYYAHPEDYENRLYEYIPHLSILMNCMYWDERYPRIFTKDFVKKLFQDGEPKIKVVGDITCDPNGSIEFTHTGTPIEDPVFVYDPFSDKHTMGFRGEGILVMAVDILPSELPADSSQSFGDALIPFIEPLAKADYSTEFSNVDLPDAIKKAMILYKGKLTPDYQYLTEFL